MGVLSCRQLLNECAGDLSEALKRARKAKAEAKECCEGELYFACIRIRSGICLFRIYANANIYNNKFVWSLRQLLNQVLCSLGSDLEVALNIKQIDGMLIHSCVFLKFDANVCSTYFHNKVCDFVFKNGALLLLSAFNCNRYYIDWLGAKLVKQLLFSVIVNGIETLSDLLRCEYIYNSKLSTFQAIELFQRKLGCAVSLNLALMLC
ncbi:MAG: hypothetical protein AAI946_00125 [Candidatus Hodgkinia cicadicola]